MNDLNTKQDIITAIDLGRTYVGTSQNVIALREVNISVKPGQFVALVGRSGSGKTTLLNCMAGLDQPTSGSVLFEGRDMSQMNESELTQIRRNRLGFVFQGFGLLPLLSAFENVELPLRISGTGNRERRQRTIEALEMVGLAKRSRHRPYELSGGEQQRVAIARAFVSSPSIILADEPTGELDSTNAYAIFSLFSEMVKIQKISVVAATHDSTLLAMADQVVEIRDGILVDAISTSNRFQ